MKSNIKYLLIFSFIIIFICFLFLIISSIIIHVILNGSKQYYPPNTTLQAFGNSINMNLLFDICFVLIFVSFFLLAITIIILVSKIILKEFNELESQIDK